MIQNNRGKCLFAFTLILLFFFSWKQFNSKTRDGFTVNTKVPSLKDQGKEYDGFTITITGDKYVFRGSNTLSNDEVLAIYLRKCHFYLHQVAFVFHWWRSCHHIFKFYFSTSDSSCVPWQRGNRKVIVEFSWDDSLT